MRFGVLGSVEVWRDGLALPPGPPRRRALLGVLLVDAGRPVPVDRLVKALWDASPPASARNAVHGQVAQLRKSLAGTGVELRTRPNGYQLLVDPQMVDLHRFRALVTEAGRPGQGEEQRAALLHDALRLWRGAPLADLRFDWVRQELAPSLEQELLDALEQRVEADLRLGAHHELVGELSSLVKEHPTRMRFWRLLMLALYHAGRQAEALRTYRTARGLFGAGVDKHLRELHQSILNGTPTRPSRVPDTPRPAGVCQLPPGTNAFVGRTGLLAGLDAVLTSGDRPSVAALSGPPGVGKTTLAVQWAHGARARFPDGQLYVNLRGYSTSPPMSPTEALARLLRGLGVRPEHVPADLAEQQALYHKALTGRRVLVVLDNTAGAAEVRPLLPTAPGTAALVTSRDRLRALAVPVLDVDVLPEADAVVLLGDVLGNELVHREPAAALELAALCARLPLALRIAGANFAGRPHASLGRYVTDLRAGNRLDALAVEGDSEAAVHAAFELSYRALPVPAQRLFRLLGLLPGADVGTGLVAVAAGLSEEDTWELLEVLLAANLVQSENGRWSCHDLLREYSVATAEDEDSPADRATALRRVYDHLADHAPSLVDTERPVLLAAAVSAAGHGLLEHSWRIATGMHDYFSARGTAAEAVAAAEAALAAAVRAGAPEAQARVHVLLGELHTRLGALRKGAEHQQSALRLSARLGDVPGEAAALDNLALIHWRLGEPAAARGYATRALALFRQVGDRRGEATALNNLGAVAQQDTRYADAIEHHERALSLGHPEARMMLGVALSSVGRQPEALAHLLEALARARAEGNRVSEAAVLSCVAAVHRDSGELAEAGRTAEQAVAVARELGDRRIEVNGLNIIALVHRRTGNPTVAEGYFQLAMRIAEEMDFRAGALHARLNLAALARETGCPTDGLAHAEAVLATVREHSLRFQEALVLMELAHIRLDLGEVLTAAALADESVTLSRQLGQVTMVGPSLIVRGLVHTKLGEHEQARAAWREAEHVLAGCGSAWHLARVRKLLAS